MTNKEIREAIAERDRIENIAAMIPPTFREDPWIPEGQLFDAAPYTTHIMIPDGFNDDPAELLRDDDAADRLDGEFWHFILNDSVLVNGVEPQEGSINGDNSKS